MTNKQEQHKEQSKKKTEETRKPVGFFFVAFIMSR